MAGDLGRLSFSLEVKSKIDDAMKRYSEATGKVLEQMGKLETKIQNFDTSGIDKARGKLEAFVNMLEPSTKRTKSNHLDRFGVEERQLARLKQAVLNAQKPLREKIDRYTELSKKVEMYGAAMDRVKAIQDRVARGGIVNPRTFTTFVDSKPLEDHINRLERIKAILSEIAAVSKVHTAGAKGHDYSARLDKLRAELDSLGGKGQNIQEIDRQLSGLYSTLASFESANRRATQYVEGAANAERDRARAVKDARIAFEPLVAAQRRKEEQEKANRAAMEASHAARQKTIQSLRKEAEALSQARIAELNRQKAALGGIYVKGRKAGLGEEDLERILTRYRQISAELMSMRSMMQNPSQLGYRDMFETGRHSGPGAQYVREAAQQVARLRQETLASARAADALASSFSKVQDSASRVRTVVDDIKSLFLQGGLVYGAKRFFDAVVQTGGDIAMQHVALRTILNDIKEADALFSQVQQLALQSPFTFPELNRDVKQLAAFGVETENLYDMTRRLADIASGLGVSFERLGLAYGQTKARSWLDGKELRQFAYAGLPMLQKIADLYNEEGRNGRTDYTTGDIRKMITKREVGFEDVDKVIKRLTDEGGQFYNMQFDLSETLYGRWNKLIDAWTIMLGKFADGKSLTGQIFTAAIDQTTEFVLALDKIAPAILGIGTVFAGRQLLSFGIDKSGLNSTSKAVGMMRQAQALQLKNYTLSQMRAVSEGTITAEVMVQNVQRQKELLTSKQTQGLAYARLLAEGRISVMQLAGLLRRKQINATLVQQLATMGLISMKQKELVLTAGGLGNAWQRILATMRLGAGSVMSGLAGLMSPANIAFAGISAAMALWMSYKQWSDNIDQHVQNAVDSARQGLEKLKEGIRSAESTGPTEEMVDNMKKIVEGSSLYTETMQQQVDKAVTLQEKYDTLLATMKEMKALQEGGKENPLVDDYSEVIKASKGNSRWRANMGLFGGDILTNTTDYLTAEAQYKNSVGVLKAYETEINDAVNKLGASYDQLRKNMQGRPFDEQLKILAGSDAWYKIQDRLSKTDKAYKGFSQNYRHHLNLLTEGWKDIVEDDIPKMAEEMASQRNVELSEYKKFCQKHPEMAGAAIRQLVATINVGDKELEARLIDSLLAYFGIVGQNAAKVSSSTEDTQETRLTEVGKHVKLKTKGSLTDTEINSVADGDAGFADVADNIKKAYKEAKEESEAASNMQAAESVMKELDEAVKKWEDAAKALGIDLTEKKDTEKKDTRDKDDNRDFKNLKARLDLIEGAYSMYKQYYGVMNNEDAAIKRVREAYKGKGLSDEDFQWTTSLAGLKSLIDGYLNEVRAFSPRNPENLSRKDELIASGVERQQKIDYDILTEEVKAFSSSVGKSMDDMTRKWGMYTEILRQTGNTDMAASVSGVSVSGQLYSGYLKSYVQGLMPSGTVLDTDMLKNMSDEEVSKYAGTLFAADDAKKIEGVANAMKKLRDQLADSEMEDAVKKVADILARIKTPDAVKARVNAAYNESKAYINASSFDEGTKAKAIAVAEAERTDAVLKGAADYRRFMSGSPSISKDEAEKVKNSVTRNLDAQLTAGTITEEDYAKGLVEAEKHLLEVTDRLGDISLYFSSGLDAVYERMIQSGAEDIARGKALNAKYSGSGDSLIQQGEAQVRKGLEGKSLATASKTLTSSVSGVTKAFNNLSSALSPVVDLATALGNTGIAEGTGIAGNAVKAGTSAFDSINGLKDIFSGLGMKGASSALGSAGPYGAAAAAALSVASSILGGKSSSMKAYEKQSEYLKSIDATASSINETLKSDVSASKGSSSISSARLLDSNTRIQLSEARKTYLSWSNAKKHKWGHRNRVKTNLDYDMLNDWLVSNGYSDGSYVGSQQIQNLSGQVLKEFRDTHLEAWADMNSEATELLEKIIEIEEEGGELEEQAKNLAEALAGFNSDTLSDDWASLLADLGSQTDDFADSLEDKLRSAITKSMVANLYKTQIDTLTSMASESGQNLTYLAKDGTVKMHWKKDSNGNYTYDESDIASEYTSGEYRSIMESAEALANMMKNTGSMLQDMYGWSTGSSSMSSSVQGISEQTGDLLASYLNAIRADVSVLRQLDSTGIPEMGTVMKAQLQQLNMIASSTLRSAEAAERMERSVEGMHDIFNRARNGVDAISVKVQ